MQVLIFAIFPTSDPQTNKLRQIKTTSNIFSQHHQTRKPRSLLQKSSLERYLKLLTRIGLTSLKICKFFDYSEMKFLSSKKPPFEKTTSSNDKSKDFFTEKLSRLEIYLKYFTRITSKQVWKLNGVSTFHTRFQACMESAMRLHCPSNSLSFIDIAHFFTIDVISLHC